MTTELAKQSRQDLAQYSLEQGLLLIEQRQTFRKVRQDDGTERWQHAKLPDLTEPEKSLLESAKRDLEARLTPCQPAKIIELLARIANHFKTERTQQEWSMLFEDYLADLREFSEPILSQAIREYRQNFPWFPKIADLRKRCIELRELDQARLERCDRALRDGQDQAPVKKSESTIISDDRHEGPRDFAALKASLMAGKAPEHSDDATPAMNTARPETAENAAELRATLERHSAALAGKQGAGGEIVRRENHGAVRPPMAV